MKERVWTSIHVLSRDFSRTSHLMRWHTQRVIWSWPISRFVDRVIQMSLPGPSLLPCHIYICSGLDLGYIVLIQIAGILQGREADFLWQNGTIFISLNPNPHSPLCSEKPWAKVIERFSNGSRFGLYFRTAYGQTSVRLAAGIQKIPLFVDGFYKREEGFFCWAYTPRCTLALCIPSQAAKSKYTDFNNWNQSGENEGQVPRPGPLFFLKGTFSYVG